MAERVDDNTVNAHDICRGPRIKQISCPLSLLPPHDLAPIKAPRGKTNTIHDSTARHSNAVLATIGYLCGSKDVGICTYGDRVWSCDPS